MKSFLLKNLKFPFGTSNSLTKIIFFGSDNVAAPVLRSIHSTDRASVLQVVTHAGTNSAKTENKVQRYSIDQKINWVSPIRKNSTKQDRRNDWKAYQGILNAHFGTHRDNLLGVVCSYGYMIPSYVIDAFGKGMIVIHPSLLPRYRGGAPIYHCLANGDPVSGVSYIDISKDKFDAGNILHKVQTEMPATIRYKQAEELLANLAAKHVNHVIANLDSLRAKSLPQGVEDKHPHAPIVTETQLPLNSVIAQKIYNLSRAIRNPKLTLDVNGSKKPVIVRFLNEFKQLESEQKLQLGTVVVQGKGKNRKLYLRCQDKYLRIDSYQQPSKGELPATAFIDKYVKPDQTLRFT